VKQALDDLDQARHIVSTGLDLYSGDDGMTQAFLELGGIGVVSVAAHVVGNQIAEQVQAALGGDLEHARRIDDALSPAYELLTVQTNPIAIKTALALLGHDVGGFRLPMVPATDEETAQVRSCLERLGLLVAA
jgi:4-hydroxy-tetrahydrodipicolinate synthase